MTRALAFLPAFAVLAALAGCADDSADAPSPAASLPPAATAPVSFDYLPKLGLDVGDIVVDDTWTPLAGSGVHVEAEASPQPVEALARMAHDRLVATGGAGRATVTVEDASLVRLQDQIVGTFAVEITLDGVPGTPPPPVRAEVTGTRTLASDPSEQVTANLLLRQLMGRMNVEFEYQVRHQLKDHLGGPASPAPTPVQSQDLGPPGSPVPLAPLPPPAATPAEVPPAAAPAVSAPIQSP